MAAEASVEALAADMAVADFTAVASMADSTADFITDPHFTAVFTADPVFTVAAVAWAACSA